MNKGLKVNEQAADCILYGYVAAMVVLPVGLFMRARSS